MYAPNRYVATAGQTQFDLTFAYRNRSSVRVLVDGVESAFTWVNASRVQIAACEGGETVEVERLTDVDTPEVNFEATSIILKDDLNADSRQALDRLQELNSITDRAFLVPTGSDGPLVNPEANQILAWDSEGVGITNVSPTDLIAVAGYADARIETFVGDGTTTDFEIDFHPGVLANLDISLGGVTQVNGVDFTWSGTTVVFSTAPPSGVQGLIRYARPLAPMPDFDAVLSSVEDAEAAAELAQTQTDYTLLTAASDVLDTDLIGVKRSTNPLRKLTAALLGNYVTNVLAGFIAAGTGAINRTFLAKSRDFINVRDYGVTGDGVTDDAPNIRKAIAAASGRTLWFPTPAVAYLCNSSLGTIGYTRLVGDGRRVCTIKKNYSGGDPFITLNDAGELEGLRFDLGNNVGHTGLGIYMANGQGNQRINSCAFVNGAASCIYFQKDGGSNFTSYDVQANTYNPAMPAVEVENVSTGGCPRSFVNFSSGGSNTLSFKLGGANNFFVANSPVFNVEFSVNNYDVTFSNCRMAGDTAYTVRGSGSIMGGGIGPAMTLAAGAAWNINPAYTNSTITDNSGGTSIIHLHNIVAFTPTITAGGSAVTLGTGGSIIGRFSRAGKLVTAKYRVLFGTGPTIPAGQWALTLPVPTAADLLQPVGSGKYTTGAGVPYRVNGIINAGASTVLLERDSTGSITSTSPSATGDGAGLWFQITYET